MGNITFPWVSRYAEPPLAMITAVFSLDKFYTALAISNTMDLLASLLTPFLDKFVFHFIKPSVTLYK